MIDHLSAGVVPLADGRLLLRGTAAGLCRWFDEQLLLLARQAGAVECSFPATIERETLERTGYFESFPTGATLLAGPAAHLALNPAVCYHAYSLFSRQKLEEPVLLTAAQVCFREGDRGSESPSRLWEFTMREIVFLGAPAWVSAQRDAWSAKIASWATDLGLHGKLEPATDLFFGAPGGRGKRLLQQVKGLKTELRLECAGEAVAVASFNLHETHFSHRFGIEFAGVEAFSGCAAFGIERWALAFLAQRGERAAEELIGL